MRRVRVRVWGRVQGVFYRASCADLARELGLAGWIRNSPDGGVEASFEGTDAAVDRIVSWCRRGPAGARVERLETEEEDVVGTTGFRIAR